MTFRTAVHGAVLATTLALAPAASAFHDSGLPPDVVQALSELTQAAQMQCQSGNQQACGLAQQFQMTGNQLGQAAQACQAGNPQACQMYQVGVQNLSAYYQQYQMTNFAQQAPQDFGRTPQQHQQFMMEQQQLFDQHNQQWQQQQQLNEEQHRRFLEALTQ